MRILGTMMPENVDNFKDKIRQGDWKRLWCFDVKEVYDQIPSERYKYKIQFIPYTAITHSTP